MWGKSKRENDAHLDTLALRQADPWLLTANNKNVAFPSSEFIVDSILDVHNIEASVVAFTMGDNADTAQVTTTSSHGNDTSVELDKVGDLARSQVDLNGIIDLDRRIGITDPKKNAASISIYFLSNQNLVQRLNDAKTYVLASCVTKYGTPPLPSCTRLTLPSLYSASSPVMR